MSDNLFKYRQLLEIVDDLLRVVTANTADKHDAVY